MATFIVYDDNKNVLRTGNCPEEMVKIQISDCNGTTVSKRPNENILSGTVEILVQRIKNGKVVEE